jgi:hypothetical protein
MLAGCPSSLTQRPPPSAPPSTKAASSLPPSSCAGCSRGGRQCAGAGVRSGHRCLEAAAGEATAVDAPRFGQEPTIEPAFAASASAEMIAAFSTASCNWPSAPNPHTHQWCSLDALGSQRPNASSTCSPVAPTPARSRRPRGASAYRSLRPSIAQDSGKSSRRPRAYRRVAQAKDRHQDAIVIHHEATTLQTNAMKLVLRTRNSVPLLMRIPPLPVSRACRLARVGHQSPFANGRYFRRSAGVERSLAGHQVRAVVPRRKWDARRSACNRQRGTTCSSCRSEARRSCGIRLWRGTSAGRDFSNSPFLACVAAAASDELAGLQRAEAAVVALARRSIVRRLG